MFHSLSNDTLYVAVRVSSSFAVPDLEELKAVVGTGFFVMDSARLPHLVTNRHVLELDYGEHASRFRGATLVAIEVRAFSWDQINLPPAQARRTPPTLRNYRIDAVDPSRLKLPANYHEDVACISAAAMVDTSGDIAKPPIVWSRDLLADDEWIATNLEVCDFVAFPGFPVWHDKLAGRPILRTGTIASDPRADYSHTPQHHGRRIAYEAFSSDGSSGSPVIAVQKADPSSSQNTPGAVRRPKVVGVNAGHLKAEGSGHSGISYFIKSSALLELLQ